jgi:hypothetical protein
VTGAEHDGGGEDVPDARRVPSPLSGGRSAAGDDRYRCTWGSLAYSFGVIPFLLRLRTEETRSARRARFNVIVSAVVGDGGQALEHVSLHQAVLSISRMTDAASRKVGDIIDIVD